MNIKIAEHAGTCFGVDNAIKIAFEAAERDNSRLYILGELVHNPEVVKQLIGSGVKIIDDVKELREGDTLIIRAHGESKDTYAYCTENNINIIDCTCPFVKRTQILASQLDQSGYKVVLVGDPEHPEVRGIAAQAESPIVVSNSTELDEKTLNGYEKLGVLAQTTQKKDNFEKVVSKVASNTKETKVFNTICNATTHRQQAANKLCNDVDLMIVIGGKNSANTKRLYEICKEQVRTVWIAHEDELDEHILKNVGVFGITAGASTPIDTIKRISEIIRKKFINQT